jgi:hypothetical protein
VTVLDSIVWRYQNARENMEQSTGVTARRLPRLTTCTLRSVIGVSLGAIAIPLLAATLALWCGHELQTE